MNVRPALVALAVLASVAGCVSSADSGAPSPQSTGAAALPDLSDAPEPPIDTARARAWWESFVGATPYRYGGTPSNAKAADILRADLEAAGYETQTLYYVPSRLPVPFVPVGVPVAGPSPVEAGIRTIVGVKEGSVEPESVVAWVAHYDSHRETVYAAYDDGSGTAVAMELARALASYDNRKTLMVIFFDGEEWGLVGSEQFVKQAMQDESSRFDLVIGHDMTGINCPGHEWPMYQMVGENYADQLLPIEEAIYRDVMKVDYALAPLDAQTKDIPKACVVLLDGHDRNSDERHFKEAGVPILRMAGGRKAVEYPAYHKVNDTIEYVYAFTGGPENYEKGLDTILRASWWNVMVFDRLPPLT